MCQHRRQEPKCKGRKKIREKDAVGQTDNDLSLVSFKLVTLLATGPWKKRAVLFYLSQKWIMLTVKLGRIKIYGPILSLSKQAEDLSVWGWKSWDVNAGDLVFFTHRHKFKGAVTAQASKCLFFYTKKIQMSVFCLSNLIKVLALWAAQCCGSD